MHKDLQFGYTLATLRGSRGLSQRELAEKLSKKLGRKIKRDTVANWETRAVEPNYDVLLAISEVLSYSVEYMLRYTSQTEKEYNEHYDIMSGLINWGMRNKDKLNRIFYIFNQFEGNSDAIVCQAYMYSKMDVESRLHVSHSMESWFESAFANRKIDMPGKEYEAIMSEYADYIKDLKIEYKKDD